MKSSHLYSHGACGRPGRALAAALGLVSFAALAAHATQPPTAAEVARLKRQGTWDQQVSMARMRGNDKLSQSLAERGASKVIRARLQASGWSFSEIEGVAPLPPPAWRGLPTTGAPKMLTVLIDFPDYNAPADPTPANIATNTYGLGSIAGQAFAPFESLNRYYYRASETLLDIGGDVLPWHRMPLNRVNYEPVGSTSTAHKQAIFNLLRAALEANAAHDYTQYDNDGDNDIDVVNIIWTGPIGAWASFWWAYRWDFSGLTDATTVTFDGKTVMDFTWEWLDTRGTGNADYDPHVLIHETGHALGVPDYYDYDGAVGPDGGVGGLDMMDGNMGNHNAFSRWMLDWISPTIVGYVAPATKTLNASGDTSVSTNKAVVVFPTAPSSPFGEFFMVENRQRVGNDAGMSGMPSDGLVVWHVDGTLNGAATDFLYDNSYTAHKLLRLMEADGLEEIETTSAWADAGDYFITGKTFDSTSVPNSHAYDGTDTGVSVSTISAAGLSMTALIGIQGAVVPIVDKPVMNPRGGTYGAPVTVTITCATPGATIRYTTDGSAPSAASPIYSAPIPLNTDTTLQARGFLTGYSDSAIASESYHFAVATPTFSPAGGIFVDPMTVTIACATAGATIRYTTDGSTPTPASPIYSGPILLSATTTLKARGFLPGYADSPVASATYTFIFAEFLTDGVAKTGLSAALNNQRYFRIVVPPGQVRLDITTSGGSGDCDMYVRFGTPPFVNAWDYRPSRKGNNETVGIDMPAAGTWFVMLHAYKAYSGVSLLADYRLPSGTVATPVFNPPGGTYYAPVKMAITCATQGAAIRYTTDGSTPTAASPLYKGNITVAATTTLKARAFKTAWYDSAVATVWCYIYAPPVTTLVDGVSQTGLNGAAASMQYFKITVPAGRPQLDIKSSGGTGDCDIYVRRGASPTLSAWDFRPARKGNTESVTVKSPAAGDWYIMVYGYKSYSGASLLGDY